MSISVKNSDTNISLIRQIDKRKHADFISVKMN